MLEKLVRRLWPLNPTLLALRPWLGGCILLTPTTPEPVELGPAETCLVPTAPVESRRECPVATGRPLVETEMGRPLEAIDARGRPSPRLRREVADDREAGADGTTRGINRRPRNYRMLLVTLLAHRWPVFDLLRSASKVECIQCVLFELGAWSDVTYQQANGSSSQCILKDASKF